MPRYEAICARQSVERGSSVSIEARIEECKTKCSGNIKIYQDKFDTTDPTGRAMMDFLVVFAATERENTQIRIK